MAWENKLKLTPWGEQRKAYNSTSGKATFYEDMYFHLNFFLSLENWKDVRVKVLTNFQRYQALAILTKKDGLLGHFSLCTGMIGVHDVLQNG